VDEYLVDLNATLAAIRAGYSVRSAGAIGDENLEKPEIAAAIDAAKAERSERVEITADLVLAGLLKEAKCKGDSAAHISARVSAWSWLGRHMALFTDKISHEGELPVILVKRGEL
jgi:phage terminase small subunit